MEMNIQKHVDVHKGAMPTTQMMTPAEHKKAHGKMTGSMADKMKTAMNKKKA